MTCRILLTRAAEQAEATAQRLRTMGYAPVIAPLVRIVFAPPPEAALFDGVQAVLLTSQNGLRALAGSGAHLPVLAVGDRTAEAALAVGYQNVRSAGGDAAALGALAREVLRPENGAVLHIHGRAVAHSPLAALGGFDTREAVLYHTEDADGFAPDVITTLQADGIAATLVYSPGAARRLAAAMPEGVSLRAICISAAAADVLRGAGWKGAIHTAPSPDEAAMLALL